jgi:hypothetical protein
MMMPEITMGRTKIARRTTLPRIFEHRSTASRNATTLTARTVTSANPIVNLYELTIAGSVTIAT